MINISTIHEGSYKKTFFKMGLLNKKDWEALIYTMLFTLLYNVVVCQFKKLVKQGLGLIVQISMFPYAYKLKNKLQLEEEGIGIIFFVGFLTSLQFKIEQNFLV